MNTILKKCAKCNKKFILGYKCDSEWFCSLSCCASNDFGGFCKNCLESTTKKSRGSTRLLNGIGTKLYFMKNRCPICNSVIQTKYFCFVFIPIVPLRKYRILYLSNNEYYGRMLKK